jgi:hypothetical protein
MGRVHEFRTACLDYLEADEPDEPPVPSLDGLTEAEIRKARAWLESLAECRRIVKEWPRT